MLKSIPVVLIRQCAVIIAVNLLSLCVGMDLGWASPVLVKLRNLEESPLSRPITENEGSWIVSIGYLFSIFTLPFMGLLMDQLGRRISILMACIPKIVAGVTSIFATEVWMLLVARAIQGVTNTSGMMFIAVYCTEISSKEIRGSLGLLTSIFCNFGVLMALALGPYISYFNLCMLETIVAVLTSFLLLFIPETPYTLYNKGKIEEAKKVLMSLRQSQATAEKELQELSETKPNQKLDKREIFRNKAYLKSMVIVTVMSIGLQFVGFNFISFYLQTILELSNTTVSPAFGSVIIGIIQIVSSIFTDIVIDRFGRRPILVSTLVTMAAGLVGLGVFFLVKRQSVITGFLNYLPLICIAIVTCSYSGGIGSLYFVIVAEILDGPIRAIGSAAGGVITSTALFFLSQYTMVILSAIGPDATFIIFGVICILMAAFIFFFVPETKQKSIAEIQRALGGVKERVEKTDYLSRF